MAKGEGLKRGNRATKRMDLSFLQAALQDDRQWAVMGVVRAPADGGDHYEIETSGATITDVLIEVTVMPGGEELTCRLANPIDGGGLWRIPAIGAEVVVVLPAGNTAFMPTVVAVLSSQSLPARTSPDRTILVAPDRIEIIAPAVYISSNGTTGDALVTREEFIVHTHPTGTGPSGAPTDVITGTTVLKAE